MIINSLKASTLEEATLTRPLINSETIPVSVIIALHPTIFQISTEKNDLIPQFSAVVEKEDTALIAIFKTKFQKWTEGVCTPEGLQKNTRDISTATEKDVTCHLFTAFTFWAAEGNTETLELLYQSSPKFKTKLGRLVFSAALSYAAYNGKVNVMGYLLDKQPKLLFKWSSMPQNDEAWDFVRTHKAGLLFSKYISTPLHFAAEGGRVDAIKFLLKKSSFVRLRKYHHLSTPLHSAAKGGHVETITFFLEYYPDHISKVKINHSTPLHSAAKRGHVAAMKLLLEKNPFLIWKTNNDGLTPLHSAMKRGQVEAMRFLFDKEPFLISLFKNESLTFLNSLAKGSHFNAMELLFEKDPQLLLKLKNYPSKPSRSTCNFPMLLENDPLFILKFNDYHSNSFHYAAYKGRINIMKFLFEKGLKHVFMQDGSSPLHTAALGGQVDVMRFLLEKDRELISKTTNDGSTPLHYAAFAGNVKEMQFLLENDPDLISKITNNGSTPFHYAAFAGEVKAMELLLENDPDLISKITNNGSTPLHYAAFAGEVKAMELLLEKDRELISKTTNDGSSALHSAAYGGQVKAMEFLLEKDPELPSKITKDGSSLLHSAAKGGQLKTIKWLDEYFSPVCRTNNELITWIKSIQSEEWNKSINMIKNTKGRAGIEQKVSEIFEIMKTEPLFLYSFLMMFPKGGDTHSHLTGANHLETYLKKAKDAKLYFNKNDVTFFKPNTKEELNENIKPAEDIYDSYPLQLQYLNKGSLRGKSLSPKLATQFFETFPVFESIEKFMTLSDLLTPVLKWAKTQKILYLEVSKGFEFDLNFLEKEDRDEFENKFPLNTDFESECPAERLDNMLTIISNSLLKKKEEYISYIDAAKQVPIELEKKKFKDSLFSIDNPVVVRLNVDVSRELSLPAFFADLALAFHIAYDESLKGNPRVIGIVISGREDLQHALDNRLAQYKMIAYFRSKKEFAGVGISLHSGELTENLVPAEKLQSAIRDAVEHAKPDRIGHAVTLEYDQDKPGLIDLIKKNKICIESCLTSNEKLLLIANQSHPFLNYLDEDIAVTLNTDDEGVLNSSLTKEFEKAVKNYAISYSQLKKLARTQLRHSFLTGKEIYKENSFELLECFQTNNLEEQAKLIKNSQKAHLQIKLEKSFEQFEDDFLKSNSVLSLLRPPK